MIKVGIIGSAGYTAGELIRILIHHPKASIDFAYSSSNAGNLVSDVHQDLIADLELHFTHVINPEVDVVFLCLGHGNSSTFLKQHHFAPHTKIIDLSNDFRLRKDAIFHHKKFIYGLPELYKKDIQDAQHIANPGCFATAIQLAILPLVENKILTEETHIQAVTGSTGAGTSLSPTTHFTWRAHNFSYYKPFTHQHLEEIYQSINTLQPGHTPELYFLPYRGNFSRGIFATLYTHFEATLDTALEIYQHYYNDAAFTFISKQPLHLKQVINTNKCLLHLHKHKDKLLITSCLDNLLKGASGQAVQNMNLMFGWEEHTGLQLKGSFF